MLIRKAAAVVSHSSSKNIDDEFRAFPQEVIVGGQRARPRVVGALVRLADEIDEDYRRADPILQERLRIPEESRFFWLFCQRVQGVQPNRTAKRIDFNIAFERDDTRAFGPVPGGKVRPFVAFAGEKLAKINSERVVVNRFLPPELQFSGLHVELRPWRSDLTWRDSRTFVFNDTTTAAMFLDSFPEILVLPVRQQVASALEAMRNDDLDSAEVILDRLNSVRSDLPKETQLVVLYDKACIKVLRASKLPASKQESALDVAAAQLVEWFNQGKTFGWEAMGRTGYAEMQRAAGDGDLALLFRKRKDVLIKAIPKDYWPKNKKGNLPSSGGGVGCVPRGTLIQTPKRHCPVELLEPGDLVCSIETAVVPPQHQDRPIAAIRSSRTTECLLINENWRVTQSQPVFSDGIWVEARDLRVGDHILDGNANRVPVKAITLLQDYFEVFDLAVNGTAHSYIANGLLCHNKMYK